MKLSFLGAAREVTGSCFLVEAANVRFLVDCGMVQGGRIAAARNHEPFAFDPASIPMLHDRPDETAGVDPAAIGPM